MARLEDQPKELQTFIEMYAWRRNDPVPWAKPSKPLSESRVGLVVMPCETLPDQPGFEAHEPDFDPTMRIIPSDADARTFVNWYPEQAFDHAGLQADPNLLIPLDRLHEMAAAGEIGDVTQSTVALCGHLPHPQRLIDETAPAIAELFVRDHADVVLLVPA